MPAKNTSSIKMLLKSRSFLMASAENKKLTKIKRAKTQDGTLAKTLNAVKTNAIMKTTLIKRR